MKGPPDRASALLQEPEGLADLVAWLEKEEPGHPATLMAASLLEWIRLCQPRLEEVLAELGPVWREVADLDEPGGLGEPGSLRRALERYQERHAGQVIEALMHSGKEQA